MRATTLAGSAVNGSFEAGQSTGIVLLGDASEVLKPQIGDALEGLGVVALLALLKAREAPAHSWRSGLLVLGLVGAALLYGDGAITPAISVLSAVEGLKIDAPMLSVAVIPITIVVLVSLFAVQHRGTGFIGRMFGPVMLVWFIVIGVLGLHGIAMQPAILASLSPTKALAFLFHAPVGIGFAQGAYLKTLFANID